MQDPKPAVQDDIAAQPYKGPGPSAAGIGAATIAHWPVMIAGLLLGGITAYKFHEPSTKLFKHARSGIEALQTSRYELKRIGGDVLNWILNSGQGFAESVTNISFVKHALGKMKEVERVKVGIEGGVFAAIIGSTTGLFLGGASGVKSSFRGRHQFDDAKKEIIALRTSNDELKTKLATTEAKLEDSRTAEAARNGTLKLAKDEPPPRIADDADQSLAAHATKRHHDWASEITAQKSQPNEVAIG